MAGPHYQRPVAEIIGDLFAESATLLRKETQLARVEASENIASAGRGLALVIGGAVLLIPALVILLQAAVAALTEQGHFASFWSALIVGGIAFLLGLIVALAGLGRLRPENLTPRRAVRQWRRDARVVQQQVGGSHDARRAA